MQTRKLKDVLVHDATKWMKLNWCVLTCQGVHETCLNEIKFEKKHVEHGIQVKVCHADCLQEDFMNDIEAEGQ